jgi:lysophospholipase L1-like esterase
MARVGFLIALLLAPFAALAQDGTIHAPAPPMAASEIPPELPLAATRFKAVRIILIGDSTMQVNSGWGGSFCAYHVLSVVACIDLARGGRSTSSYRAERSWEIALDEMKSGGYVATYVLIQFGHNDQPGKPGRSTDLATQFPVNLRHYVEDTRAAGAIPVLITPLTRREFINGKLDNNLLPWADAVRKVAAEMNVPLLDLNAESAAAVQAMGPQTAMSLAQAQPSPEVFAAAASGTTIAAQTGAAPRTPMAQDNASVEPQGDPKRAFDYTHLGVTGADYFSQMIASELARAVPALRHDLLP